MTAFITDSKGEALSRQTVIDRLCQYDVYLIMKNIDLQDYSWLCDIREDGFRGYQNYSDDELKDEWLESEAGWSNMIESEEQLYNIVNTKETA